MVELAINPPVHIENLDIQFFTANMFSPNPDMTIAGDDRGIVHKVEIYPNFLTPPGRYRALVNPTGQSIEFEMPDR